MLEGIGGVLLYVLLYVKYEWLRSFAIIGGNGGPDGTRTRDLRRDRPAF